ncbi:MAG TPA: tyrosine-type recombinase/integrase [Anaerolineae bacterium]|nr:tyrosine-type recombinase/integrase [Anaerolineae bacterium]HID84194.1 hypothetical protein [Anaerolineales bacterium]HIQ08292.1 hypothetical protein [Anaerolineaceae bacterium]
MEEQIRAFIQSLADSGAYSEGTLASYRGDLRKGWQMMSRAKGQTVGLDDLSPELILSMIQAEIEAGRKRSTIQRRVASWRAFDRFLLQYGLRTTSFMPPREALIALWQKAAEPAHAACLSSEQLQQLWTTLLQSTQRRAIRDLALIALFVEWGFPSQMVIQLRVEHVDLERRVVYVPQPVMRLEEFPLEESYEPLRRYLERGRPEFDPKPGENALFVSQLGRGLSRQGVWQLIQGWGAAAGLSINMTPRVLRNTAVLRMIRRGEPLERIQTALGHANPISTSVLLRRVERLCRALPMPIIPRLPEEAR